MPPSAGSIPRPSLSAAPTAAGPWRSIWRRRAAKWRAWAGASRSLVVDPGGGRKMARRNAPAPAEGVAGELGHRHRVRFERGGGNYSYPAILDAGLRRRFGVLAQGLGLPAMELASGA